MIYDIREEIMKNKLLKTLSCFGGIFAIGSIPFI